MWFLCWLGLHKWTPWTGSEFYTYEDVYVGEIIIPKEAGRICLRCHKLQTYIAPDPNKEV